MEIDVIIEIVSEMKIDPLLNSNSIFQPERLSEKTVNGLNAFNESMKVYENCLSKPMPNEMKKLFCGSDSLTSMET